MSFDVFLKNPDVLEFKGSIPYWVIASRLDVHEQTVRNWMKKDMSTIQKEKVMSAIRDIKQEMKSAN